MDGRGLAVEDVTVALLDVFDAVDRLGDVAGLARCAFGDVLGDVLGQVDCSYRVAVLLGELAQGVERVVE